MRWFVVSLLLMALSASCSRAKPETKSDADASPPAADAAGGSLSLAPPPADDWQEVKVSNANVKIRVPTGATVPADRAGRDTKFAGSYFRVVMPSGTDVYFAERHGTADAGDVAIEKLAFRARAKDKGAVLYEADDALVVVRDEGPPVGKHCETTACGKIAGRPLCATAAGARVEGTQVKKLTETECLAIVTIARSIQDL
jgi:hypothetical protein